MTRSASSPAASTGLRGVAARGPLLSWHAARMGPFGRTLPPRLLGISSAHHIALTFDDGPDSRSTPRFAELLADLGVHATFFLLGAHVTQEARLVGDLVCAGHELGVHGWDHRPATLVAGRSRPQLAAELRRTRETIEDITGVAVSHYRPPYGIVTPTVIRLAAEQGLETVLWSAWGRDWRLRSETQVVREVGRTLRPGGTVLLHDTDRTAAPDCWRTTLGVTRHLLTDAPAPCGPLREHWRSPRDFEEKARDRS